MSASLPEHYREILIGLGEDPEREGLLDTPKRAAKAMQYLCHGYEQSVETIVNGALFASDSDEMVIVANIELYSLCEHHLLPFIGKAHVAYIPTGKVLGLSKIARIVDMFARRLQIQENLTREIADAIESVTQAAGVAVVIEAQHMCMMMRGVEKQNSSMITSVMLGEFREMNDGWTIKTRDRSLSAQWEHTVLVTETGYEILTVSPQMPAPPAFIQPKA